MTKYTAAQEELIEKLKNMGLIYSEQYKSFGYRIKDTLHLGVFKFDYITTNWGCRELPYEEILDCCYATPEWRFKKPGEYYSVNVKGNPFYVWEESGLKFSVSDVEDPERQKEIIDKVSKCVLSIKDCIRQEEQSNMEKDFE